MITAVRTMESDTSTTSTNSWLAWLVVINAAWFFFYVFMILNMFNAINEPFMAEFSISAAKLGWLSSFYSLANLCFLFPAGMILDRVSTRRVILITMTVCVVATFIFANAPSILVAVICRFAMGIGGAFCLLSAVRLASRWFPPQKMASAIGVVVMMAFIGGMVAQNPLTVLTQYVGWRHALMFTSGIGVFMWIAIFTFVRDFPADYDHARDAKKAASTGSSLKEIIRYVVSNKQNWLGGLYTSLLNLPIFIFGFFGTIYLEQIHQLSRVQASFVTMMLFVGAMIGSPVIGWISDRIGLRRMPMLFFGVLSLITILLMIYVPGWSMTSLVLLFFALGYFISAQVISYPLVAESNPHHVTGAATGLASTLIMAGLFSQPIFGWLLGLHWDGTKAHGVPIYTLANFNLALAIIPIACVIGLVAAFFLRETYCKGVEDA